MTQTRLFQVFLTHHNFSYDCVRADASLCGKEGSELKKTPAFFLLACQLHSTGILLHCCKTLTALIQCADLNQIKKSSSLANASIHVNMVIKQSSDLHEIGVTKPKWWQPTESLNFIAFFLTFLCFYDNITFHFSAQINFWIGWAKKV